MTEPMDKELARLVYEELVVEQPGYTALPEPMAKALIRLGVNNGIRFSTLTTDKLSVEKLQEQLNTAKKALTNIKLRTERDELETYYVERNHDIRKDAIDALAAIGGDDE